ncbi:MAG: hypothetical protein GY842_11270 [bacterium]|nr:hypothetical protein [bacterium]
MNKSRILSACCLLALVGGGCVDLDVNIPDNLLAVGTPFVISGTAEVIDRHGPCLIWIGENGVSYHLFQDPLLDSGVFDTITTPGTTSRLELAERNDLEVSCQVGPIMEVQDVLEIVE